MLQRQLVLVICLVSPVICSGSNVQHFNQGNPRHDFVSFQVPGSLSTVPLAINDAGAVTGYYYSTTVPLGGFIRDPDGCITTFEVPGSSETEPISINARGEVVGYWGTTDSYGPPWQGFVRSRWGGFETITVSGSTSVWPVRINRPGMVVGYYSTASDYGPPYYGFIRSRDGVITTFSVPGALDTLLTSINDAGEIIGFSFNGVSDSYFTLSRDGSLTSIPLAAASINGEGDFAGSYSLQQGYVLPRHGDLTLFNFPGASVADPEYLSINGHGTVMASYSDQANSPVSHGFIRWPDGDIISFDPPKSGTTVATGLNDANVITGFYYIGTSTSALGFLRFPRRDDHSGLQP